MANPPYGDSSKDPAIVTYAAGTMSLTSSVASVVKGSAGNEFNDDCARPGQPNGYYNEFPMTTVGGYNAMFNNAWLSYDKPVVLGINGRQT